MSRFLAQIALIVMTTLFVFALMRGPVASDGDGSVYYPPTAASRKLVEMQWQADEADRGQQNPPLARIE